MSASAMGRGAAFFDLDRTVLRIDSGMSYSVALTTEGEIRVWGANGGGQFADGADRCRGRLFLCDAGCS